MLITDIGQDSLQSKKKNGLITALAMWRTWLFLSFFEIQIHYRRSILGPFWITLNMLALVVVLGLLYSTVFSVHTDYYVPYLCAGLLGWNFISLMVTDGLRSFIDNSAQLRNTNIPVLVYPLKTLTRTVIVFMHHCVALMLVYLFYPEYISWRQILVLPALVAYILTGFALVTIMGILAGRFRDVPNIATNVLQAFFFITPIFWPAKQIDQWWLLGLNPLYHYIEVFRAPLLGEVPAIHSWLAVAGATVASLVLAWVMFRRYSTRIVHLL